MNPASKPPKSKERPAEPPLHPPKINVFIVSWQGFLGKSIEIARDLARTGAYAHIIHSEEAPVTPPKTHDFTVSLVSNEDFFGAKFKKVLDLAEEAPLLLIQADADAENWGDLFRRFQNVLARHPIGVWAPAVDHTSWVDKKVEIRRPGIGSLVQVSQTDAIVLGLSGRVITRLKELDFTTNNLGWGIDWAAIVHSMSIGELVVRDFSIRVRHKKGSGYQQSKAASQQEVFLEQLSDSEKAMLVLLRRSHGLSRRLPKFAIWLENRIEAFWAFVLQVATKIGGPR